MGVTYNCTGSRDLPLAWRCTKCGKLNIGAYRVSATGSHRNKARAEEMMHRTLEKNALNTVLDAENRRFDRVRFKNKCPSCGESPSWSNLPDIPPKMLKILRNIALVAAVGLAALSISSGSGRQQETLLSLIAAALFAVLALVCLLVKRRMLGEKAVAVDALPPANRPWLAQSGPELQQRLTEEHILTAGEMSALGITDPSVTDSGRRLSQNYRSGAETRKAKDRSGLIRNIAVTVIALAVFGVIQVNSIQTAGWEEKMEKAGLFEADPQAGDKFVVQEKLHSGKARFVKKYLAPEQQAAVPEEVGYIIEIKDSTEIVGTYKAGLAMAGNAYRIDSTIRLYDRHTGTYIGDPISLTGGDPPRSIKSSKGSGYGSRPDPSRAVSQLVQLVP